MNEQDHTRPVYISIGIMAWNEESSIGATLKSLFQQSVFQKLNARKQRCEVLCIPNGCTDGTAEVARGLFERMRREHPCALAFTGRVMELEEPGRNNAWNRFVHDFSARESRFLYLMDADILFHHPDTIYNLFAALERNPHGCVSSGRQIKEVFFKKRKTMRDRLSLATSDMTGTIAGRFSGQLYCMRSDIARRLYLPRDLGATDDGFFKAVICRNFLTGELDASRILAVPDAAHIYEAYVRPGDILNNQKRQMIGQTSVHVLVEHLKALPREERIHLADTLRRKEEEDPDWLKKLLDAHLSRTRYFWRLFPGLLTFRFRRLMKLKGLRKVTHLPAAMAGFAVTMIACRRAFHALKRGQTYYWPKASRQTILEVPGVEAR